MIEKHNKLRLTKLVTIKINPTPQTPLHSSPKKIKWMLSVYFFRIRRRAVHLCIIERKNGPYTCQLMPVPYMRRLETLYNTITRKETFNDQTARQRLIQKLLPYAVREHEVS
jgi:hypothetical protein